MTRQKFARDEYIAARTASQSAAEEELENIARSRPPRSFYRHSDGEELSVRCVRHCAHSGRYTQFQKLA